jgi:hypothetical protein
MVSTMVLSACGAKDEGPKVLNVWSFTNEIRTMAIAFEGKHPDVDVIYTMIPMTDGEYQTKLKATIGTADVPDVIALEAIREILTSGGRTLPQGALGWLWARSEQTIPIPGFRTVEQVKENCQALDYGPLGKDQMQEIELILKRS